MTELAVGQLIAVLAGILFFGMEYLRLRKLGAATIEGLRFWAFISAAEITVWFAVRSSDLVERACIVALGTILAALVINNAYVFANRARLACQRRDGK